MKMNVKEQVIETASEGRKRTDIVSDIEDYLKAQSVETLCDLILEETERNQGFRRRLQLLKDAETKEIDVPALRKALKKAILTNGRFIDYHETASWVYDIEAVTEAIAALSLEKHAYAVRDLSAYGMTLLSGSLEYVDDSDGETQFLFEALQSLHIEACLASKADPEELAEFLLREELKDDFCFFEDVLTRYAEVLGEAGLARYRALADELWAAQPSIVAHYPGFKEPKRDRERSHLRNILTRLYEGDAKALIRIFEKDLSDESRYLALACQYDADCQPEKALEIAEKGWEIFCQIFEHSSLREYLAEAYSRAGRVQDVWALLWKAYDALPSWDGYERLKFYGERLNLWEDWKNKVISRVNETATPKNAGLVIQIYLAEDMPEEAWNTMRKYGCDDWLLLKLADIRGITHPQDAIDVYKPIIEAKIQITNNEAYAQAFGLVKKIHALSVNDEARNKAFIDQLAYLEKKYKAKRNMIRLLERFPVPA